MMQTYYIKFDYANYAHLYQYCLYQAIMRYSYAEKLFDDLSFAFYINNSGNLVLASLPVSINPSRIKITRKDVETAFLRIFVHLGRSIEKSDSDKLTKLFSETPLRELPTSKLVHFTDDSFESPFLSFREHEKDNDSAELYAGIEADSPEEAVVAAILLEPFLDAISREIQYLNSNVLSARSGDQIYISSTDNIDCEKNINLALSSLHKQKFDVICKNNIDYLIKNIDLIKIFNYSGIVTSKEKAVSLLKDCDMNSALRAISIAY